MTALNRMPTKKHATGAKPVSVQTIARQMVTEAGGDLSRATDKLVGYIANFPRLTDEVLRIGARKLVDEVPQIDRQAIRRAEGSANFVKGPHRMNDGARKAQERLLKRAGHLRNSLLSMPYVIDGMSKPLGEWIGSEIEAYGETQLMAGATQVRHARFAIAVGRAAGSTKIGEALDEAAVGRIHTEAMASEV